MRRLYWQTLIVGLSISMVNSANSESKQATLEISAHVVAVCEAGSADNQRADIDFGTLDFGTHYFLNKDISSVGQPNHGAIRIKCANGINFTVLMDGGQSGNTADRYLVNESGNRIRYNLYVNASHDKVWDDQTGLTGSGNGQDVWLPVYGLIPAQPTPAQGVYTDTVNVTIKW